MTDDPNKHMVCKRYVSGSATVHRTCAVYSCDGCGMLHVFVNQPPYLPVKFTCENCGGEAQIDDAEIRWLPTHREDMP